MTNKRPAMFIGSSAEGLAVAKAIQLNLDRLCEVSIWSQGVFGLSSGTLETLTEKAPQFDFAILVLTPDDMTLSRTKTAASPRDNVVFELGLFIGILGKERVYIVVDRTADMKLPSDLAGITPAGYEPHSSGNLTAALGACCTQIESEVRRLGARQTVTLDTTLDITRRFQDICNLLDVASRQLFILLYEQPQAILRRESRYGSGLEYAYTTPGSGSGTGHYDVDKLCHQLADAELLKIDLRNRVELTDEGRQFAEWLVTHGHKAAALRTTIGGWGNEFHPLLDKLAAAFMQKPHRPPSGGQ